MPNPIIRGRVLRRGHALLLACGFLLAACGGGGSGAGTGTGGGGGGGVEVLLGTGDHSSSSVTFVQIAAPGIVLRNPADLAFSPITPNELWIVNKGDPSIVIFDNVTAATITGEKVDSTNGPGAWGHFLSQVAGIAWGAQTSSEGNGWTLATSQDSPTTSGTPYFMGPTLWSADRSVLRVVPAGGNTSHLDMLHSTTYGKGIAHETGNVFWTFGICLDTAVASAPEAALTRYDFGGDHSAGQSSHADGVKRHYVIGQVATKPGVHSGLDFHAASSRLFVSDTGNGRIVSLDTTSGTQAAGSLYTHAGDGVDYEYIGATLTTVVAAGGVITDPAGLTVYNNTLFVADNATGVIHAFDLAGNRLNWIDTGLGAGALSGIAIGPDGKLYFCDLNSDRIVRIDP